MAARRRIVLYNPRAVFFDMPLALLAIGSALDPARFEVVIVDGRLSADPRRELLERLPGALCLGITVLTGRPLDDALAVSAAARAARPELPIVWGGWHTSLFPTQPLKDESCIDVTVQGQGEATFRELVECLAGGGDLAQVPGICYRRDGAVQQNPPRALQDMGAFPAADYSLIDVPAYFARKARRQFDYVSSTGCHFRCSFCADPFVFGRKFSAISPERMVDELEAHWRRHRFDDLNFQDETFFTYPRRIRSFAEGLLARQVRTTWAATLRADQGCRMDEEEWRLAQRSGLRRLLIGVESGSQEMLDRLQKDITVEQVLECAERCRRLGIEAIFPFIVGFPDETEESVRATVALARRLSAMSPGFRTQVFYFKPYPGSRITTEVERGGYRLPRTTREWADFDYVGSRGPWVSPEKYAFFERFKFYNRLAWSPRARLLGPLQHLARWRVREERFGFPLEKLLADVLRPSRLA